MTLHNKPSLILRGTTASETTPNDVSPDQKTNAVPNQANHGACSTVPANGRHGCRLGADEHALLEGAKKAWLK